MKHIRALSRTRPSPQLAQQSALEIKVEFFLDALSLALGKFPREPLEDAQN